MPASTSTKKQKRSNLSQYLQEIGEIGLLTADQEKELAQKIQDNDDPVARQHMLRANLRLVVNIAKKYAPSNDPDLLLDLIQEGNIGLMKAVDRFLPERGTRFSTYGVYWIKQAILRALKARRIVRLPENVVDRVLQMQRTRTELYQLLGRAPTADEVAEEMGTMPAEVHRLEQASAEVVSLERTVRGHDQNEATELGDLLEDIEAPQPDEIALKHIVRSSVRQAVSSLPARERKIVEMRFGLAEEEPHTLEDIGHEFGISRERVRQLQNAALNRLRRRQLVQRTQA